MHAYSKFAARPPVFVAPAPDPTSHPKEFAPMEHMAEDDELVYPVRSLSIPSLRFTRALAGRKFLSFEGLLAGAYVEALADPGATHSFASAEYLRANNLWYKPVSVPDAHLDDGTTVRIFGLTDSMTLKFGHFRVKHSFLVVDMDAYECVLGMSFFHQVNPAIDWRARTMRVNHKGSTLTLSAIEDEQLLVTDSKRFELCSFNAISKRSLGAAAQEEALLDYVIPECCAVSVASDSEDPLFSGPGALLPDVKPVLAEFRDVLVSEIPGGLPPECFGPDGLPIEHCIETAPGETPYARPPRGFTPHEDAEVQK